MCVCVCWEEGQALIILSVLMYVGSLGTVAWFSLAFFAYDIGVAMSWLLFMLTHLALASPDVVIDGAVTERYICMCVYIILPDAALLWLWGQEIVEAASMTFAESKEMPGSQATCNRFAGVLLRSVGYLDARPLAV